MQHRNQNKKNKLKAKFFYKSFVKTLLFLLIFFSIFQISQKTQADQQQDLGAQKWLDQQKIGQLNQQIQQLQTQISQKRQQQASLKNDISLYDMEIQSTQLQIQATQTNIDNTNLQISAVKEQIQEKTDQINKEKQTLGDLILNLDQYDNTSDLQLSLSTDNFSDFLDEIQYTKSIQSKVYDLLGQIKDMKAKLEQDQKDLQESLDKLNQLQDQLTATSQSLNDQKNQKIALLTATRGQESKYQSLLSSAKSEEDEINQEIYQLDQRASGKGGGIAPIHGILAWPLNGIITQGYGNTGFTSLGYNFHNGIDIAGPAGTPVYATGDGTIEATGTGQAAYGNWVAIRHQIAAESGHQIITLYGHLMSFTVNPGQKVKQGDLIGFEGNTGNTTRLLYGPEHGFHLHFSVFDADGFGISPGAYQSKYGPYQVPYGKTYNPLDFL